MWDLGTIVAMNNDKVVKKKMNKGLNMTFHLPQNIGLQKKPIANTDNSSSVEEKKKK